MDLTTVMIGDAQLDIYYTFDVSNGELHIHEISNLDNVVNLKPLLAPQVIADIKNALMEKILNSSNVVS